METTTLKSFASKARTDLIKEVGARVSVVLAENSLARVESLAAVRRLEEAIVRDGRDQVIDRVAYTWFNRIIALRFMDANGYTPSAIVSPEAGRTTGQPEVLAEAKAGSFDSSVLPEKTQEMITALFNRTRPSQDPDGEAYGLLLEAYCRSWHKAMPFMFEREGDYTELLIPAALLAVDSVRDRAVKTLTEDVCRDVEVIGWLYQFYIAERKDEVFEGFKKNKRAGAAEIPAATQLFTPHWIVRYLVENSLGRLWLLNNPSSRLAEQMDYYIKPVDEETDFLKIAKPEELKIIDPAVGSGHMLTYAFDLLYAIYMEKGYDPAQIPSLILQHNLYGTEIDPRAGALAAFALTMKAAAKRKLFLKNPVQPNVCVLASVHFAPEELDYLWSLAKGGIFVRGDADEFWNAFEYADTLGSLIEPKEHLLAALKTAIDNSHADGDLLHGKTLEKAAVVLKQSEYLSRRYSVVVANPPYMGASNMGGRLSEFAVSAYRSSKSDLFAMFIERCGRLARDLAFVGMITMHTWMFIASFEKFRAALLKTSGIRQMAHLGTGAFDSIGGEVVSTVAFVFTPGSNQHIRGVYLRLVADKGEAAKSRLALAAASTGDGVMTRRQDVFFDIPGAPVAYWLSEAFYTAFAVNKSLGDIATPRTGMRTGNNVRFLRYWHEVSEAKFYWPGQDGKPNRKWVVYAKGGASRQWFGNLETVVNWENDGFEIKEDTLRNYPQLSWDNLGWKISNESSFFTAGVTWTDMSTTAFGARWLPAGCIFDAAGPSLFGEDSTPLLGLLNSSTAFAVLTLLNPTLHFKNYNIAAIPVPHWDRLRPPLESFARQAVALSRRDWADSETSWAFASNPIVAAFDQAGEPLASLSATLDQVLKAHATRAAELQAIQQSLNQAVVEAYGITDSTEVGVDNVTLTYNPFSAAEGEMVRTYVLDLISYAVGCMFGRYSLDAHGLVLSAQGATLQNYLEQIPTPSFMPDQDNVIPIVDGDWFEDDIVARFRKFLRVAFGEEHFEENLRFVTESLGVKDIRDYFVRSFYDDHVRRYKKRPIYWLFRSPKGSFSALIYLHRYNPSTVSTVLTGYLREFIGKLEANLEHQARVAAGMGGASARDVASALKEADRIRKVLVELRDYEHDVLFPLAGQQIALDLDHGVLVNYQKLGAALKDIGLKKGGGGE